MGAFPCVVLAENCAAGSLTGDGVVAGVGAGVVAGEVDPAGVRMKLLLVSLMEVWLMLWTQTVKSLPVDAVG
jgi:hypothetical protein